MVGGEGAWLGDLNAGASWKTRDLCYVQNLRIAGYPYGS